jgi:hypothetical protein
MSASYVYYQMAGIEPYLALDSGPTDNFGGGAQFTNDNLMLTLWNVTEFDESGNIPIAGDLIKPYQFTQSFVDSNAAFMADGCDLGQLYMPAFKDRYRAAFQIQDVIEGPQLGRNLLAILQPPQGATEKMLRIIQNVRLNNSKAFGMTFKITQSGFWCALWEFLATSTNYEQYPEAQHAEFGGLVFTNLPLTKTNGMDGNFPEFYATSDLTDEALVGAELRELVAGAPFYIPCLITRGSDTISTPTRFYISWPHTIT